jgi:hypothetical protein
MTRKIFLPMTAIVVVLLVIGVPLAQAQQAAATGVPVSPLSPAVSVYAEGLYTQYDVATAGKVSFSVQTVENGYMADLGG